MIHIKDNKEYLQFINNNLKLKKKKNNLVVCDLFSGAGGLSYGFEALGYKTIGFESKEYSVNTYNKNFNGKCLHQKLNKHTIFPKSDIIIGGPPCQPFSVSGNQKGKFDDRDGFPIFLNALKQLKPKVFLIENVRGTLFRNKSYMNSIINKLINLNYKIDIKVLNAYNFGVPQKRERLFILGSFKKIQIPISMKIDKINAEFAIKDLIGKKLKSHKFLTKSMDTYIANYEKKSKCINPRDLILNKPSRTLTCRNLGGQTSDMMRIKIGNKRRLLTVKEAARLQSFPDSFEFLGSEYQKMEQIGNSVPPVISLMFADIINNFLLNQKLRFDYEYADENQLDLFREAI
jgi:DNA (cytosine-5)-methyltransferase 1